MSAEDLEKYETEMELQLYREYRDVVGIFKYVVETDRRFYLCNQVDVKARTEAGDVFFEVIFEDLELKTSVLGEIVPQLPQGVYFWSNTSSLDIDVLAEAAGRPELSIVCHGMNPVPLMAGVELVPCAKTTPETVEHCRKVLLEMHKAPFVAPNIPGFWVNRLLIPYILDAVRVYEDGLASREDIDTAIHLGLNHPMGPLTLLDFVGLDTCLFIADAMYEEYKDPRYAAPPLLRRMVLAGHLGRKSGKGFYDY